MPGKRTNPEVTQRWREIVEEQAQSQLSVRDFCLKHQLNPATFYIRRRRLNPPATPNAKFVPVHVVPTSMIEVILSHGLIVRVPAGFDPVDAAKLVAALGDQAC